VFSITSILETLHLHPTPVQYKVWGFTPIPAQKVKLPLVEECETHLECVLHHHLSVRDEIIFLGEIIAVSIDKAVFESRDPYSYPKAVVFLEDGTFGVIKEGRRARSSAPLSFCFFGRLDGGDEHGKLPYLGST